MLVNVCLLWERRSGNILMRVSDFSKHVQVLYLRVCNLGMYHKSNPILQSGFLPNGLNVFPEVCASQVHNVPVEMHSA